MSVDNERRNMNLQPSEFIAKTQAPDSNPLRIGAYNMVPGTVVCLRSRIFVLVDALEGPHQWVHAQTGRFLSHEQFAARMRGDTVSLPVVLFDPLGTNTGTGTGTNTGTDTNTDKENNND
nr:MAG TPA: hypothetical protein [Caudoviricetes sp.]